MADANIGANIGERIASLEAEFKSFRNETLKDNEYIRQKLDYIANLLSEKVDRAYCHTRHEKLDEKVGELGKDGKYTSLEERLRELEQKAPAIIQQIVLGVSMGIAVAIISYVAGGVP